jgi:phosphoribosylformylglycinamidine synthase subunit PurL
LDVFEKWGLDGVVVGEVIPENRMRVKHHGEIVAEIPNEGLTDDAPLYHRPVGEWKPPVERTVPAGIKLGRDRNWAKDLHELLASPNICSKRWVTEQYDSMVQTNTMEGPGQGEAGVIRVKGTKRGLAMKADGNGRWCYLEPKTGALLAVAEAARNVACTGAKPVAATNCLNFGSPEKPEIMRQFSDVIDGITEACTALETPITGGNVSFYNETFGEGIYPTPVIGIVGMIEDVNKVVVSGFKKADQAIVIVTGGQVSHRNEADVELGSSEYALHVLGAMWGLPPAIDLKKEKALHELLVELARAGLMDSAKDVGEGGIAVALAEECFKRDLGAEVSLISANLALESVLFGEDATRVLISCDPEKVERIQQVSGKFGLNAQQIGSVTGENLRISVDGETVLREPVSALKRSWAESLEKALHVETEEVLVPNILQRS